MDDLLSRRRAPVRAMPSSRLPLRLDRAAPPRIEGWSPTFALIRRRCHPHELLAMLAHHYERARRRALPRRATAISCLCPDGRPAVMIEGLPAPRG